MGGHGRRPQRRGGLAFQDLNRYAKRHVTGGVYPISNTDVCPANQTCGVMQSAWPMPFANTGFPAPNDFSNSAGIFEYTSGVGATTLSGRYVDIQGPSCLERELVSREPRPRRHQRPARPHLVRSVGRRHRHRPHRLLRGEQDRRDGARVSARQHLAAAAAGHVVNDDDACNAYYAAAVHSSQLRPDYREDLTASQLHFFRSGDDYRQPLPEHGRVGRHPGPRMGSRARRHDAN